MSNYMLILSSGPTESRFHKTGELARQLKEHGHDIVLFLVQNATLAARSSPAGKPIHDLAAKGIEVLADDFSLKERGIMPYQMAKNVVPAPLDRIIDSLSAGHKVLWQ